MNSGNCMQSNRADRPRSGYKDAEGIVDNVDHSAKDMKAYNRTFITTGWWVVDR